ncbi:hypothetical protein GCM10011581_10250 [Saccharopolyspora subtropica]|uniref:Pentapeptide repeat protein n=1 Tax=Saccharopolyspora thermophila TaxID=89367 RepID=A0A917N7K7_9PSEU|nr:pentapeptide repeat-containing protein [Saccharopolyspora subtropica]GGI75163.1 hypothetical protein GCM10011581_10250 [Saccharopolyspora subtropica]
MSSGTHDWQPRRWPNDPEVVSDLRSWLAGEGHREFYAIDADLRGADLSGGDFTSAWFMSSNLADTTLRGIQLADAECTEARFTRADLSDANFAEASLDRANFVMARLARANFTRATAMDSNFQGASLAGATLVKTLLSGANFTDADLEGCNFDRADLSEADLTGARIDGTIGLVRGPVVVQTEPRRILLDGSDLEEWFRNHGSNMTVRPPSAPPDSVDEQPRIIAPVPVDPHQLPDVTWTSSAIHVDLPHSQLNRWVQQLGRGPEHLWEIDVRNVASVQALANSISPGATSLAEAIRHVRAKVLVFTKLEQLGVRNRPVLIELLHTLPTALAARKASGTSLHIGLVDLSADKADVVIAELGRAPTEDVVEPITIFDYPTMP